ncbi:4Fe-4S binding protein [Desulfosediminicola sp.]|uniref:4Fe-4S binding protein n=1 Tax=Desulfosediminicola sp. TaxID=2886825 RepID=UPI003AF1F60F
MVGDECVQCERCVAACPVDVFQRESGTEQQWLETLLTGVVHGELTLYCGNLNEKSRKESGVLLPCLASLHAGAIVFLGTHGVCRLELSFGNCNSCLYGGGWEHVEICLNSLQRTLYLNGLPPVDIRKQESVITCSMHHDSGDPGNVNNALGNNIREPDRRTLLKQVAALSGRIVETTIRGGPAERDAPRPFDPEQTKHRLYLRELRRYRDLTGGKGEVRISPHSRIIDHELCNGCGLCSKMCRNSALVCSTEGDVPIFDVSRCSDCGLCETACRRAAIRSEI